MLMTTLKWCKIPLWGGKEVEQMEPDNDVLLLAYFKQHRITQQALADSIGRSVNTVWNKLHGRSHWNTAEVQQLHDDFGVPTQYFFRN